MADVVFEKFESVGFGLLFHNQQIFVLHEQHDNALPKRLGFKAKLHQSLLIGKQESDSHRMLQTCLSNSNWIVFLVCWLIAQAAVKLNKTAREIEGSVLYIVWLINYKLAPL